MSKATKNAKMTKRRIMLKLLGLSLIALGAVMGLVLLLAHEANIVSVIVCAGLAVLGLILAGSPEAWLAVIDVALRGGSS
jgi:hypothetical protein